MKRINYGFVILLIVLSIGSIISSCNKSVDGNIEDGSTRRSFTPSKLKVTTKRDSAVFTFAAPLFAVNGLTYTIEISKDTSFSTIDYSVVTDTTMAVVTDANIALGTPYHARVRVNPYKSFAASNYYLPTGTFKLVGIQYLKVIRDFEISTSSVLLHWYVNNYTSGVTKMVLSPSGGTPIEFPITAGEAGTGEKNITGLNPAKKYAIQLFAGTKSMGTGTVTTYPNINFTTTLSSGDDLATAITNAVDGDIIGLNPGSYSLTSATQIVQKNIAIRSVSNNPADTKILSRELDIVGDGAGLTIAGVEVNGNYSVSSYGATFLQMFGSVATNGVAANFNNIIIDNCIIHDYTRCLIRGNYGAAPNNFKISSIAISNSQIYNIDQINTTTGSYMLSLEKVEFTTISFTKSTFYSTGEGMINMSTALAIPTTIPSIVVDYCTMNNVGGNNKYLLFDANANIVNYAIANSILANTPINSPTNNFLNPKAFRATAIGSSLSFSFNNYFNFTSAPGYDLGINGLDQLNNNTVDLGWLPTTTNFSLAPLSADNPVFTASTNEAAIGDPRWAY